MFKDLKRLTIFLFDTSTRKVIFETILQFVLSPINI